MVERAQQGWRRVPGRAPLPSPDRFRQRLDLAQLSPLGCALPGEMA
jgi:hypothetical protein